MTRGEPTIVAPATAAGGAIAVVRFSGPDALTLCDRLFRGTAPLSQAQGYTVHYGRIMDGERTIDDVLATVFRAPHSYTGEDSVEISCHGSAYIVSEILRLAQAAGARMAEPGEFTIRAYLAGKLDLSQAEAVADLIASSSRAAHALATGQMRGGYSAALEGLRQKLLDLASLLELELDFSEEDVEFADREELRRTMESIRRETDTLRNSFSLGNALKEGVAVAIAGAPNAGKSTLLNRLLHDDRALVSDIAGTTRDVIEEQANIDGVVFRFLDTAGIRTTDDRLEQMGIERTLASIARARIVIHLIDATTIKGAIPAPDFPLREDQTLLTVINKTDAAPTLVLPDNVIGISALSGSGVDMLCRALRSAVDTEGLFHGDTVVSNSRHFQALSEASAALDRALLGLQSALPSDLLAEEIRSVIRALSSITGIGAIIPDNILSNIFSKFCIGK
ncbi:tRNA uridine-5-carboxymethylaminomethyl(34) synthesis GTPase MnmE [uncultured Alistipes sp.]|uniref:tRNA uridine-5-carboxymethylaminomethyl(34) synthesis GTPase MnmE n=1 Tax=uncultured Alistipes sp. TaxID=538949 RepID=UPI0025A50605|nr:tRNA uridine-5-carboxymethylaminomethyl(34) synthesis GTPase MnmE [uncultured Alistipes sp.]